MNGRNNFLKEVRQKNKLLFTAIIIYLGINFATSIWGWQTTPFYIWAMYSIPLQSQQQYHIAAVYCDGNLYADPHTYNDYKHMMTVYSLRHYVELKDSSHHIQDYRSFKKLFALAGCDFNRLIYRINSNQEAINRYPAWLKSYLSKQSGKPIHSLEIYDLTLQYGAYGRPFLVDKKLLAAE